MKKRLTRLLIVGLYSISNCCLSQIDEKRQPVDFYVIDTITIDDPVLLRFSDENTDAVAKESVLVSKKNLMGGSYDPSKTFLDFLSTENGYLLFTASRFSCLMSNLFFNFPHLRERPLYMRLQTDIRDSEKDAIWVNPSKDTPKEFNGLAYDEIYPRQFIRCLVKGSALEKCRTIDEIRIAHMDNVYFQLLVPVTWK